MVRSLIRAIAVGKPLWDRVLDEAKNEGISASAYVRTAITEKLTRDEFRRELK